ncbi:uncharacterized protein BROUX77_004210 [Berkeleyomyces rouxiae]|uniref:uncharacterized protein n=1 Tax=Berkeleyomyces rouxiae TaxID=2035830 RepID=UPI003B807805
MERKIDSYKKTIEFFEKNAEELEKLFKEMDEQFVPKLVEWVVSFRASGPNATKPAEPNRKAADKAVPGPTKEKDIKSNASGGTVSQMSYAGAAAKAVGQQQETTQKQKSRKATQEKKKQEARQDYRVFLRMDQEHQLRDLHPMAVLGVVNKAAPKGRKFIRANKTATGFAILPDKGAELTVEELAAVAKTMGAGVKAEVDDPWVWVALRDQQTSWYELSTEGQMVLVPMDEAKAKHHVQEAFGVAPAACSLLREGLKATVRAAFKARELKGRPKQVNFMGQKTKAFYSEPRQTWRCEKCGRRHDSKECREETVTCTRCKKTGHSVAKCPTETAPWAARAGQGNIALEAQDPEGEGRKRKQASGAGADSTIRGTEIGPSPAEKETTGNATGKEVRKEKATPGTDTAANKKKVAETTDDMEITDAPTTHE